MVISEDTKLLIDALGLRKPSLRLIAGRRELWALCPNPKHSRSGDRTPTNFSINIDTGVGFCFACQFRMNVFSFFLEKGMSYEKTSKLWAGLRQKDYSDIQLENYYVDDYLVQHYRKIGPSEYVRNRVNDDELVKLYEICSDEEGNPIFFIKDNENKYRAIWTRENDKYYLIAPLTSKSLGSMFGMNLPTTSYTILTEGFFDAIHLRKYLPYKTLTLNGTFASESQLKYIRKQPNPTVWLDFDDAGRQGRTRLHQQLSNVESFYCGAKLNGVDPDDLSGEQIKEIWENKKNWFEYKEMSNV